MVRVEGSTRCDCRYNAQEARIDPFRALATKAIKPFAGVVDGENTVV